LVTLAVIVLGALGRGVAAFGLASWEAAVTLNTILEQLWALGGLSLDLDRLHSRLLLHLLLQIIIAQEVLEGNHHDGQVVERPLNGRALQDRICHLAGYLVNRKHSTVAASLLDSLIHLQGLSHRRPRGVDDVY